MAATVTLALLEKLGACIDAKNAFKKRFKRSVSVKKLLAMLNEEEEFFWMSWLTQKLYLSGLTSAEGLTLPQSVGGSLYLMGRVVKVKDGKIAK